MGEKRCSDSAIEQFVFFCVKASVAAVKMEISWVGGEAAFDMDLSLPMASDPEDAEGMAFGSCEDVFSAGPFSVPGDGGGVGYASCGCCFDCNTEKKLSRPLVFGSSH